MVKNAMAGLMARNLRIFAAKTISQWIDFQMRIAAAAGKGQNEGFTSEP
jgi:hypothetical protein